VGHSPTNTSAEDDVAESDEVAEPSHPGREREEERARFSSTPPDHEAEDEERADAPREGSLREGWQPVGIRRPRPPRSPLIAWLSPDQWAAAVVLAVTLLAVGGIHPAVALVFGAACGMVLVVSAWRGNISKGDTEQKRDSAAAQERKLTASTIPFLSVAFLWLAFISLLQTLPLPRGLLGLLSPTAAQIWGDSLRAFGQPGPAWAPLSLAPEATRTEVVKWAAYAALAWVGHRSARRSLTPVASIPLVLALVAAFVTVAHGLTGATRLYGLYEPSVVYPRWRMGPLLNANHLSGYLTIGLFAGLGLLFEQREKKPEVRAALLLAIGTLAGGVVLLGSRAAMALLAVALLGSIGAQLARARRDKDPALARTALILLGIIGLAVVLPVVGYEDEILEGFAHKNYAKLLVAEDCVQMWRDFPLLGVGRGAFEGVYFAYRTGGTSSVWTHPENIVVQWLTEWGAVGTFGAVTLLAMAIGKSRIAKLRTVARFLGVGILTVLAQNLVDFSLELPAVMGLVALLAGAVLGSSSGSGGLRVPAATPYALAGAIVLLALGAAASRPQLQSTARKNAWLATTSEPVSAFSPYMSRFPADPYFPLYAAAAAGRTAPLQALPFHNQMLERAPTWSVSHLSLAETLYRAGRRSQALLEVRIALEREPTAIEDAAAAATRYGRTADEIVEAAPAGDAGLVFLERIVQRMPKSAPRHEIRAAVLDRDPCQPALQEEVGTELTRAILADTAPCHGDERALCVQRVLDCAERVGKCPGGETSASYLLAELAWAKGDEGESLRRLDKLCESRQDSTSCLRTLAERAAKARQRELVARTIRRVTARECDGPEHCAAAWAWAADMHHRSGEDIAAFVAATRAATEVPTELRYQWLRVECAERVGSLPKVVVALETILARHPDDARAKALLAKARGPRTPGHDPNLGGGPARLPP
jgi:hypothetical protein